MRRGRAADGGGILPALLQRRSRHRRLHEALSGVHQQPPSQRKGRRTTEDAESHGEHGEGGSKLLHTALSKRVIGLAIGVHRELGPGLLESIYEECLCLELARARVAFERQATVPVTYKGDPVSATLRIDIVVEGTMVVEVKAIDRLLPIHEAQLLTYLKVGGYRVGLLMNFNVIRLLDGIKRLVR